MGEVTYFGNVSNMVCLGNRTYTSDVGRLGDMVGTYNMWVKWDS